MIGLPDGHNDILELQKRLKSEPESEWVRRGEEMALELFHQMAVRVPAYKRFLSENKIDPKKIVTIEDFKHVPTIDKDNYLRQHPRKDLSWDGEFGKGQWSVSTTSGSTGQPFYFPRQKLQDDQYALTAELYLRENFNIHKQKTLYIVAFPMGAWIGGVFTYEALQTLAVEGNYDLTVITPGINKTEVINSIIQLADDFDQIIIGSYAPFLKDIIEDGKRAGISWKDKKFGFIFSAEAFNEAFRDYVVEEAGHDNPYVYTLNHYGTVDMGTMAHETSLSVLIRRDIFDNIALRAHLLPEELKQPTLAQYVPEMFYFEQDKNALYCTSNSGLPLVRYDLKDYGGVLSVQDIEEAYAAEGSSLKDSIGDSKIGEHAWNLPFVYVYERSDFSVRYYAFLVYPDVLRRALQHDEVKEKVTGKFTMASAFSTSGRQHLHVFVELMHGESHDNAELQNAVAECAHTQLLNDSSEYRETFRMVGDVAKPHVKLFSYEDPEYFKPGTKQKWVIK